MCGEMMFKSTVYILRVFITAMENVDVKNVVNGKNISRTLFTPQYETTDLVYVYCKNFM